MAEQTPTELTPTELTQKPLVEAPPETPPVEQHGRPDARGRQDKGRQRPFRDLLSAWTHGGSSLGELLTSGVGTYKEQKSARQLEQDVRECTSWIVLGREDRGESFEGLPQETRDRISQTTEALLRSTRIDYTVLNAEQRRQLKSLLTVVVSGIDGKEITAVAPVDFPFEPSSRGYIPKKEEDRVIPARAYTVDRETGVITVHTDSRRVPDIDPVTKKQRSVGGKLQWQKEEDGTDKIVERPGRVRVAKVKFDKKEVRVPGTDRVVKVDEITTVTGDEIRKPEIKSTFVRGSKEQADYLREVLIKPFEIRLSHHRFGKDNEVYIFDSGSGHDRGISEPRILRSIAYDIENGRGDGSVLRFVGPGLAPFVEVSGMEGEKRVLSLDGITERWQVEERGAESKRISVSMSEPQKYFFDQLTRSQQMRILESEGVVIPDEYQFNPSDIYVIKDVNNKRSPDGYKDLSEKMRVLESRAARTTGQVIEILTGEIDADTKRLDQITDPSLMVLFIRRSEGYDNLDIADEANYPLVMARANEDRDAIMSMLRERVKTDTRSKKVIAGEVIEAYFGERLINEGGDEVGEFAEKLAVVIGGRSPRETIESIRAMQRQEVGGRPEDRDKYVARAVKMLKNELGFADASEDEVRAIAVEMLPDKSADQTDRLIALGELSDRIGEFKRGEIGQENLWDFLDDPRFEQVRADLERVLQEQGLDVTPPEAHLGYHDRIVAAQKLGKGARSQALAIVGEARTSGLPGEFVDRLEDEIQVRYPEQEPLGQDTLRFIVELAGLFRQNKFGEASDLVEKFLASHSGRAGRAENLTETSLAEQSPTST